MNKVKTTKIGGGADYAKVSDRLKQFRADNPRASITTTPAQQESGMVMFKAHIIKDKADEFSADATGHALQTKAGTKDFEKLETIAVGRALALLGYASDGEIASSEEMEEFEKYQEEKQINKIQEALDTINQAKTLDELKNAWAKLDGSTKQKLEDAKEKKKTLLSEIKNIKNK